MKRASGVTPVSVNLVNIYGEQEENRAAEYKLAVSLEKANAYLMG